MLSNDLNLCGFYSLQENDNKQQQREAQAQRGRPENVLFQDNIEQVPQVLMDHNYA